MGKTKAMSRIRSYVSKDGEVGTLHIAVPDKEPLILEYDFKGWADLTAAVVGTLQVMQARKSGVKPQVKVRGN